MGIKKSRSRIPTSDLPKSLVLLTYFYYFSGSLANPDINGVRCSLRFRVRYHSVVGWEWMFAHNEGEFYGMNRQPLQTQPRSIGRPAARTNCLKMRATTSNDAWDLAGNGSPFRGWILGNFSRDWAWRQGFGFLGSNSQHL